MVRLNYREDRRPARNETKQSAQPGLTLQDASAKNKREKELEKQEKVYPSLPNLIQLRGEWWDVVLSSRVCVL